LRRDVGVWPAGRDASADIRLDRIGEPLSAILASHRNRPSIRFRNAFRAGRCA